MEVLAVRANKTVYRDGDKSLKIFNSSYATGDILRQAMNQTYVETTGLNVPKLLEVTKTNGEWTIVTEYIQGKNLEVLMGENPDKEEEYLDLFVDLQLEIQSKQCPMLTRLVDKMNRKISETDFFATTRYQLHKRLDAMPRMQQLCHGDFNPSNVIIAEDGTPYIIDWTHATQGNGPGDAAITYMLFILHGYKEGAEKYLNRYCAKSGTERERVMKWLPIVAASRTLKGIESEKAMLDTMVGARYARS